MSPTVESPPWALGPSEWWAHLGRPWTRRRTVWQTDFGLVSTRHSTQEVHAKQ